MTLRERIDTELKTAMKAKDKVRLAAIRSIKKALLEKEVELRSQGKTLGEAEELALLSKEAKQRRDSIEQYRQGGREDLAEQEAQELAIIESYLPKQLSDEEIRAAVDEAIAQTGASSLKDMGKVMGPLMQKLKGRADGQKVQAMVKEKLS